MLQETVLRLNGAKGLNPPLVIANAEHRFIVAEQLMSINVEPKAIILEPVGRNTAPAAAIAALVIAENDPDGIMVLLPSDHVITDDGHFLDDLDGAIASAGEGSLVAFGITPDRPETGYGYIRRGAGVSGIEGCYKIDEFVEKPDLTTAERYLESGEYLWNSGMFVFSAKRYLDELEQWQPEILSQCRKALAGRQEDLDFLRLDEKAFNACPSNSIDYAVMEKTAHASVMMARFGWSDVGAWTSLWEISERDDHGNVTSGDTLLHDVTNSYIRSEGGQLVSVIGVEDMVVVSTDDAIMVAPKDRASETSDIVALLSEAGRPEAVHHKRVYRPWGSYQGISEDDRFRVKRIVVKPGASLSLQKHSQRSEHWVVVKGRATITRGDEQIELEENQSTYIPNGMTHRLENNGDEPLHIIEVQVGDYLGEDDIIRLDDHYGR